MKITQEESGKSREFIRQKVIEHNMLSLSNQPKTTKEEVNFIAYDEVGNLIGGITGTAYWGHMHIDFLWVDPNMRGQRIAEHLMQQMEQHSRSKKYRLMVVDTFSFQAPDFYEKQGFREYGILEDHPKGHSQYYLEKRLAD